MSESFLSQEEVDALLEGVTGESQKTVEEAAEHGEVRAYNISSQERIVRGRMPTMEIVNERFGRLPVRVVTRKSPSVVHCHTGFPKASVRESLGRNFLFRRAEIPHKLIGGVHPLHALPPLVHAVIHEYVGLQRSDVFV